MLLVLALVACGHHGDTTDTDTDTDTDTNTLVAATSAIWHDCGPADGPALRLAIDTGDPQTCSVAIGGTHTIEIYLWADLPTDGDLPHTMTLGGDYASGSGNATYCADPTDSTTCETSTGGQVIFTDYIDGTSVAGSFSIDIPSGTLSGTFGSAFCPHTTTCG